MDRHHAFLPHSAAVPHDVEDDPESRPACSCDARPRSVPAVYLDEECVCDAKRPWPDSRPRIIGTVLEYYNDKWEETLRAAVHFSLSYEYSMRISPHERRSAQRTADP